MGSQDRDRTARQIQRQRKAEKTPQVGAASHTGRVSGSRTTAAQDCYDSLREFMGTGQFRRLLVRTDAFGGCHWVLKAVLELPTSSSAVYMCGSVKHADALPDVIDYCLRKGDWREDKYPAGE